MLHITKGYGYHLTNNDRIQLAVRAIEIGQAPPKQKLPITLPILERLYNCVYPDLLSYNVLLTWTAMTLGHFGCLRSGEFTVSGIFNSNIHICRNNITFHDSLSNPYMNVHLKMSKTDYKNEGVNITIACTAKQVCAYCSMLKFCLVRDLHASQTQPLFIYTNGQILSRELFVSQTKKYMSRIGLNPEHYSGHSYRIGGATSAAVSGLKDWEIKKLGRWKSSVYIFSSAIYST
jgi:hypothetical protein